MQNADIAKTFERLANLLELKGESTFKTQAYRKASRVIKQLPVDIDLMVREHKLKSIPGVGEAIAKKIEQLVTTGKMDLYERVKAEFPQGITDIMDTPHVGPRLAARFLSELHITTIDQLKEALEDGRVAAMPRVGGKTARKILDCIENDFNL